MPKLTTLSLSGKTDEELIKDLTQQIENLNFALRGCGMDGIICQVSIIEGTAVNGRPYSKVMVSAKREVNLL